MKYLICILLAYLIGSLSPSALVAKIKCKDLKKEGSGNLGATNTALVIGRYYGLLVMILDIFKGFLVMKISSRLVPGIKWFALLSGLFAIIGHCFPFYLKFQGGKGLATFAGIVLTYNPALFLFLLVTGVIIMLIANSSAALVYYVALVFPIYVIITESSIPTIVVCIIISLFMMIRFIPNLKKAINGQELKSRDFLKRTKSEQ